MAKHLNKIDQTRDILFRTRFQNELDYLNSNSNNKDVQNFVDPEQEESLNTRVEHLTTILKSLDGKVTGQENFISEINDSVYKKAWKNLPIYHKIVKWKEFMATNKSIKSKKQLKSLTDQGLALLTAKKLNSNRFVTYDSQNAIITAVPALIYDDTNNTYSIKV